MRGLIAMRPPALLLPALLLLAGAASAQEAMTGRIGVSQDWSAFAEGSPRECSAASAPLEQVNTRDGQPVQVQRGEAQVVVYFAPSRGVDGQVSFSGGYAFASNSTVAMDVDGETFTLFTEGDWAMAASPEEDARLIAAMKAGARAVLTGQSGRGTVTRDTFSLRGFTAMVNQAAAACAG